MNQRRFAGHGDHCCQPRETWRVCGVLGSQPLEGFHGTSFGSDGLGIHGMAYINGGILSDQRVKIHGYLSENLDWQFYLAQKSGSRFWGFSCTCNIPYIDC